MTDTTDKKIQEGEIISNSPPSASSPTFDINTYNATLEIVRRRLTILEKSKNELKQLNEMYSDIFINDPSYIEADNVVKETQKKKKDERARISKQPQAAELFGKIKDLKEQIKENQAVLSEELMEYYKTSGVTEIEDSEGNVQEFQIIVKLKPKKKSG